MHNYLFLLSSGITIPLWLYVVSYLSKIDKRLTILETKFNFIINNCENKL